MMLLSQKDKLPQARPGGSGRVRIVLPILFLLTWDFFGDLGLAVNVPKPKRQQPNPKKSGRNGTLDSASSHSSESSPSRVSTPPPDGGEIGAASPAGVRQLFFYRTSLDRSTNARILLDPLKDEAAEDGEGETHSHHSHSEAAASHQTQTESGAKANHKKHLYLQPKRGRKNIYGSRYDQEVRYIWRRVKPKAKALAHYELFFLVSILRNHKYGVLFKNSELDEGLLDALQLRLAEDEEEGAQRQQLPMKLAAAHVIKALDALQFENIGPPPHQVGKRRYELLRGVRKAFGGELAFIDDGETPEAAAQQAKRLDEWDDRRWFREVVQRVGMQIAEWDELEAGTTGSSVLVETDPEFQALVDTNRVVVLKGAPGTGKTVQLMLRAKKEAEEVSGNEDTSKPVAYVAGSSALIDEVRKQIGKEREEFVDFVDSTNKLPWLYVKKTGLEDGTKSDVIPSVYESNHDGTFLHMLHADERIAEKCQIAKTKEEIALARKAQLFGSRVGGGRTPDSTYPIWQHYAETWGAHPGIYDVFRFFASLCQSVRDGGAENDEACLETLRNSANRTTNQFMRDVNRSTQHAWTQVYGKSAAEAMKNYAQRHQTAAGAAAASQHTSKPKSPLLEPWFECFLAFRREVQVRSDAEAADTDVTMEDVEDGPAATAIRLATYQDKSITGFVDKKTTARGYDRGADVHGDVHAVAARLRANKTQLLLVDEAQNLSDMELVFWLTVATRLPTLRLVFGIDQHQQLATGPRDKVSLLSEKMKAVGWKPPKTHLLRYVWRSTKRVVDMANAILATRSAYLGLQTSEETQLAEYAAAGAGDAVGYIDPELVQTQTQRQESGELTLLRTPDAGLYRSRNNEDRGAVALLRMQGTPAKRDKTKSDDSDGKKVVADVDEYFEERSVLITLAEAVRSDQEEAKANLRETMLIPVFGDESERLHNFHEAYTLRKSAGDKYLSTPSVKAVQGREFEVVTIFLPRKIELMLNLQRADRDLSLTSVLDGALAARGTTAPRFGSAAAAINKQDVARFLAELYVAVTRARHGILFIAEPLNAALKGSGPRKGFAAADEVDARLQPARMFSDSLLLDAKTGHGAVAEVPALLKAAKLSWAETLSELMRIPEIDATFLAPQKELDCDAGSMDEEESESAQRRQREEDESNNRKWLESRPGFSLFARHVYPLLVAASDADRMTQDAEDVAAAASAPMSVWGGDSVMTYVQQMRGSSDDDAAGGESTRTLTVLAAWHEFRMRVFYADADTRALRAQIEKEKNEFYDLDDLAALLTRRNARDFFGPMAEFYSRLHAEEPKHDGEGDDEEEDDLRNKKIIEHKKEMLASLSDEDYTALFAWTTRCHEFRIREEVYAREQSEHVAPSVAKTKSREVEEKIQHVLNSFGASARRRGYSTEEQEQAMRAEFVDVDWRGFDSTAKKFFAVARAIENVRQRNQVALTYPQAGPVTTDVLLGSVVARFLMRVYNNGDELSLRSGAERGGQESDSRKDDHGDRSCPLSRVRHDAIVRAIRLTQEPEIFGEQSFSVLLQQIRAANKSLAAELAQKVSPDFKTERTSAAKLEASSFLSPGDVLQWFQDDEDARAKRDELLRERGGRVDFLQYLEKPLPYRPAPLDATGRVPNPNLLLVRPTVFTERSWGVLNFVPRDPWAKFRSWWEPAQVDAKPPPLAWEINHNGPDYPSAWVESLSVGTTGQGRNGDDPWLVGWAETLRRSVEIPELRSDWEAIPPWTWRIDGIEYTDADKRVDRSLGMASPLGRWMSNRCPSLEDAFDEVVDDEMEDVVPAGPAGDEDGDDDEDDGTSRMKVDQDEQDGDNCGSRSDFRRRSAIKKRRRILNRVAVAQILLRQEAARRAFAVAHRPSPASAVIGSEIDMEALLQDLRGARDQYFQEILDTFEYHKTGKGLVAMSFFREFVDAKSLLSIWKRDLFGDNADALDNNEILQRATRSSPAYQKKKGAKEGQGEDTKEDEEAKKYQIACEFFSLLISPKDTWEPTLWRLEAGLWKRLDRQRPGSSGCGKEKNSPEGGMRCLKLLAALMDRVLASALVALASVSVAFRQNFGCKTLRRLPQDELRNRVNIVTLAHIANLNVLQQWGLSDEEVVRLGAFAVAETHILSERLARRLHASHPEPLVDIAADWSDAADHLTFWTRVSKYVPDRSDPSRGEAGRVELKELEAYEAELLRQAKDNRREALQAWAMQQKAEKAAAAAQAAKAAASVEDEDVDELCQDVACLDLKQHAEQTSSPEEEQATRRSCAGAEATAAGAPPTTSAALALPPTTVQLLPPPSSSSDPFLHPIAFFLDMLDRYPRPDKSVDLLKMAAAAFRGRCDSNGVYDPTLAWPSESGDFLLKQVSRFLFGDDREDELHTKARPDWQVFVDTTGSVTEEAIVELDTSSSAKVFQEEWKNFKTKVGGGGGKANYANEGSSSSGLSGSSASSAAAIANKGQKQPKLSEKEKHTQSQLMNEQPPASGPLPDEVRKETFLDRLEAHFNGMKETLPDPKTITEDAVPPGLAGDGVDFPLPKCKLSQERAYGKDGSPREDSTLVESTSGTPPVEEPRRLFRYSLRFGGLDEVDRHQAKTVAKTGPLPAVEFKGRMELNWLFLPPAEAGEGEEDGVKFTGGRLVEVKLFGLPEDGYRGLILRHKAYDASHQVHACYKRPNPETSGSEILKRASEMQQLTAAWTGFGRGAMDLWSLMGPRLVERNGGDICRECLANPRITTITYPPEGDGKIKKHECAHCKAAWRFMLEERLRKIRPDY